MFTISCLTRKIFIGLNITDNVLSFRGTLSTRLVVEIIFLPFIQLKRGIISLPMIKFLSTNLFLADGS